MAAETSGKRKGKERTTEIEIDDRKNYYWTDSEDRALLDAMQDLTVKGHRSGKPGFDIACAKMIQEAIPGTCIIVDPHVKSKLKAWKREYTALRDFMGESGVEVDPLIHEIKIGDDISWDAMVVSHPQYRKLRRKKWPYYNIWREVFGNDRATGANARSHNNPRSKKTPTTASTTCGTNDSIYDIDEEEGYVPEMVLEGAATSEAQTAPFTSTTAHKTKRAKKSQAPFILSDQSLLDDMQIILRNGADRIRASASVASADPKVMMEELRKFHHISTTQQFKIATRLYASEDDRWLWSGLTVDQKKIWIDDFLAVNDV